MPRWSRRLSHPRQTSNLSDIVGGLQAKAKAAFDIAGICFGPQLAFVTDPEPFATACCSRRAGKTTGCASDLLATALETDDVQCLYITTSRINAKRIFWPVLKRINKQHGLGGIPNESDLCLKMPNGSVIYCLGAKDIHAIDDFLGLPIKRVYIDEAQTFRPFLIELIDRVLAPALLDHAGEIRVIGTPAPVPAGVFWDLCHSAAWSHHSWTFWDNPHVPTAAAAKKGATKQSLLERELKRQGVTIDDPSIQREFFGRWVEDLESLVLQYKHELNHWDTLPEVKGGPKGWRYVLGVDLGFQDSDALALLAWHDDSPNVWLVEELVTEKQDITALVAQIEGLRSRYPISKIVIDTGGLGKKIAEEIQRRFGVPLTAADKVRKLENLALLNDALRRGHFKAKDGGAFAHDARLVEWDREKSTPDKLVISTRYHSDIVDAVLYAFKETPAYAWTPPPVKPQPGTREYQDEIARELEEQAEEYFRRKAEEERGFF